MSWKEVGELGLRYGRIPLALICVEIFYWFLTIPSDTLAPIQVTEAWLWHEITNFLFGEVSTLTTHNGWMTRIDFQHVSFPGPLDSVGLYVSDECAGVHEMIFLSTLVMMTDGVSQRMKLKTVGVMCAWVYLLNLLRLVMFYPIAINGCIENADQQACLSNMWEYHKAVYEWGFLVVMVLMWLIWFLAIGGPTRTIEATKAEVAPWRFTRRTLWKPIHLAGIGLVAIFLVLAFASINSNESANEAKAILEICEFSNLISSQCADAQQDWDDAIGYAWSLGAMSLVMAAGLLVIYERPNDEGDWPSEQHRKTETEEITVERKSTKKAGSWRRRGAKEEE